MPEFANSGDFCPNEQCADYGKLQKDQESTNITKFGKTKAGCQRYQCTSCGKTFTETKGTIFYRRRTAREAIIDTLAQVAEGDRISSLSRSKGHKVDTIQDWIQAADEHTESIEEVLLKEYSIQRGQLDGLWSYVKNKGEKNQETEKSGTFWRSTMIEIDTRLRVARGIGKTETHASIEVFEKLQRRGHPDAPPPTVSDGWGGIDEAMVAVYGKVPEYTGIGRPPTLKPPQVGWQYLQVIKQRENGQVIGTRFKVVFGEEKVVLQTLGKSTSFVERTHLTMRQFNGRLAQKNARFLQRPGRVPGFRRLGRPLL